MTMKNQPKYCPRCAETHSSYTKYKTLNPKAKGTWYIKKGYFKTKHNGQPVPRYECKICKKCFSSHSLLPNKGHKKPKLNLAVFRLYVSGMTQRRIALVLGVNRKTVASKFLYLARQSRTIHDELIKTTKMLTTHVQFDEMETHEHTSYKPLSIALAVRSKTGEILEARVSEMAYHGKTEKRAFNKYGYRPDMRHVAREDVLRVLNSVMYIGGSIVTDGHPAYMSAMKQFAPNCMHVPVNNASKGISKVRRNTNDALWRVNHVSAKIRNDLSRMSRKTWTTTKKMWALQAHLDLYIAFNNKYVLV